ncbi:MAG: peptidase [Pseudomonadota bacterium]
MTYCVGLLVKDGLVMIGDTRTNAGLDNIATYRKLHLFESPGERVVCVATAGNLAISQAVLSLITEGLHNPDRDRIETVWSTPTMFSTAQLVGRAVREVYRIDGPGMEQVNTRFDVMILLGGQIATGRLRLFQIYSAGNFIESAADTPYVQIGEHKYGKPILDRAASFETELYDAVKLGLISMDSTMRSNLGVGMPLDLVVLRRDRMRTELDLRIEKGEPYFEALRESWSRALSDAHQAIPTPPWAPSDAAAPLKSV